MCFSTDLECPHLSDQRKFHQFLSYKDVVLEKIWVNEKDFTTSKGCTAPTMEKLLTKLSEKSYSRNRDVPPATAAYNGQLLMKNLMSLTSRNSTNYKNIYEMLRLSSCSALLSTLALAGSLAATSAHADEKSLENKVAIDSILASYQAECNAEQTKYGNTEDASSFSMVGELNIPEGTIYQIDLDVAGKTATVVYPEFRCENAGWKWCGTGGCGFHIVVDGMNFQRKDGFRPQSIRIPTPIGEDVAVMYAVHGTQCQTPREEFVSGSDYCYSTAIWNEQLGTFLSRDERLLDMDPSLP